MDKIRINLKELEKRIDAEKLAEYIDNENSKNWIGKDLYKRKLENHQNKIYQLRKNIAVIKNKLTDLEERGFRVVRKKVNINEIHDGFPLSYKLFLSEIGELKILSNKPGKANKSCFEIFSPFSKSYLLIFKIDSVQIISIL